MKIKHSRSEIRGKYSRLIKIIKFHGNFFYLTKMGLYVGSIEACEAPTPDPGTADVSTVRHD